jgi:hypothetical protein
LWACPASFVQAKVASVPFAAIEGMKKAIRVA